VRSADAGIVEHRSLHAGRDGGVVDRFADRLAAAGRHERRGHDRRKQRHLPTAELSHHSLQWRPAAATYMPVMWKPASTINTSPVIPRPASLSRNAAASPTSLVSMFLRSGARSRYTLRMLENPEMPAA